MDHIDKPRIQKPLGVYVLTTAVVLVMGVLQFLLYLREVALSDDEIPKIMVFVPVFLCTFTAASAIWAACGDNNGRVVMLVFVSLNFLWWLFLIVTAAAYDSSHRFVALVYLPTLIRPLIIFVLCWWFFNKSNVVAYYKQGE
jgi:hypothetical protein